MQDEEYMKIALDLAKNGLGRTSPNPLVGAVVAREGRVAAVGWHRKAGTPHAEVHALRMAGDLAKGATLYVTLEPCAHYGRTGPCAKAVIEAGIRRVVIAMEDPNPLVAGKGIAMLREAGLDVSCGLLEAEARKLNEVFLKWIVTGMPFVTMKTAMSLDGKIATVAGKSQWITNEASRERVHEWRDIHDGILVGIQTVLVDNPSLTTRLPDNQGKHPVRIVLDSKGRTPTDSKLLTDGKAETIIAVTSKAPEEHLKRLKEAGASVLVAGSGDQVDLPDLLHQLGKMEICSLFVEGGAAVNFSFLQAGLVDRVHAFIAPKLLGGREALTPVGGTGFAELSDAALLDDIEVENLAGDVLISGYVRK